jgi:hypothetical protein
MNRRQERRDQDPAPEKPLGKFHWGVLIFFINAMAVLFLMWSPHLHWVRQIEPVDVARRGLSFFGVEFNPAEDRTRAQTMMRWLGHKSVTELIDRSHGPSRGAGYHSYALLVNPKAAYRNGRFLEALLALELEGEDASNRFSFYLPVFNRDQALAALWNQEKIETDEHERGEEKDANGATEAAHVLAHYDYDLARELLRRYCRSASLCPEHGFAGPYLLIAATPMPNQENPSRVLDLGRLRERAFAPLLEGLSQGLTGPAPSLGDPTGDQDPLAAVKDALSHVPLSASDWLDAGLDARALLLDVAGVAADETAPAPQPTQPEPRRYFGGQ